VPIAPRDPRFTAALITVVLTSVATGMTTATSRADPVLAAPTAPTAIIDGSTTYQTISGFGVSEAFGQAVTVMHAAPAVRQRVLDLLFSPTTGAGLTILRNEIPSDRGGTIEPTAPSGPAAAPAYRALGDDEGQEWMAKQAQGYGVKQFLADAWGAPAFMKTNESDSGGGVLCGVPGTDCARGDWRQAYANYLVQYAKDYRADGIALDYLGFENEANVAPSYSGMRLTPAQTANFADVFGPTLAASGLSTRFECCAGEGWDYAASYTGAITADPVADSYVKLITSHGYTAAPAGPLSSNSKPVWQTEWSTFDSWNPAWDDGSDASGFTWAQHIYTGLASAGLGAFLYWWGSATPLSNGDNESLLEIDGPQVTASSRLWAFANYSRYVHPGATRIGVTSADADLDLTAFANTDGTVAVVALNASRGTDSVSYSLRNTGIGSGTATPHLTNASSTATTQSGIPVVGGAFTADVPARSLVTYLVTPSGFRSPGPPPSTPPVPSTPSAPSAPPALSTPSTPPPSSAPPSLSPSSPTTSTPRSRRSARSTGKPGALGWHNDHRHHRGKQCADTRSGRDRAALPALRRGPRLVDLPDPGGQAGPAPE
jgi:O-glycosyl hydrolase